MKFNNKSLFFIIFIFFFFMIENTYSGNKIAITLCPYQFLGDNNNQEASWVSNGFPDILSQCFRKYYGNQVRIVDRERVTQHLNEIGLEQAGYTNSEHPLEAGKMFRADFSIYGNIYCPGKKEITITAKIVNVETTEERTVNISGKRKDWYKHLGDSLVNKIYPELLQFNQQRVTQKQIDRIEKIETNEQVITTDDQFQVVFAKSMGANAHFYKGVSHIQRAEWKDAENELRRAIELDPEFARAYVNLGTVYMNLGQYAIARDNFYIALKIYPQSELAYENLGLLAANMKDFNSAALYFKKALNFAPDNFEIKTELGKTYYEKGELDSAKYLFNEILFIDSSYVAAEYYLGLIAKKNNNYSSAETHWLKVIKSDEPYFSMVKKQALLKLGDFWLQTMNNPSQAIPFYEQVKFNCSETMNKNELIKINFLLGINYLNNKKPEKALNLFLEIIDIEPANFQARYYYALSLYGKTDTDRAISQLETICTTAPASSEYFKNAKKLLQKIRGY